MNEKNKLKKRCKDENVLCVCTWVMESPKRRKVSNEVYATIGFEGMG